MPERAVQTIKNGIALLTPSPFACRKAGSRSFIRKLIIGAIRYPREDDYH